MGDPRDQEEPPEEVYVLVAWKRPTDDWITSDAEHLYRHDAIVALDVNRGLNNET